jgi:uncharacterized membrane protein YedE/YeeE
MDTWPWWVAGPLIGLVVPLVYLSAGRKWGVSSVFRDLCAAAMGRGSRLEYFRYDWKAEGGWRLAMVLGVVVGAALATILLPNPDPEIGISAATRADLAALGISDFTGLAPRELFSWAGLASTRGLVLIVVGGFLVGFGTRWAGGCTSGHSISGLAALQLPSLVATLGFFAGGLAATYLLLPLVLRATP